MKTSTNRKAAGRPRDETATASIMRAALELADEARAEHESRNAAVDTVLGRPFRQGWSVGRAAPDHSSPLNVHAGVARIHATDM